MRYKNGTLKTEVRGAFAGDQGKNTIEIACAPCKVSILYRKESN